MDDHELLDLISRGMYRDRSFFERRIINRLLIVTKTWVHTTKVNYDGIAVPYVGYVMIRCAAKS